MSKTTRVAVRIALVVDVDRWNAEYGNDETVEEIRAAVAEMAVDHVKAGLAYLAGTVTVKEPGRE